MNWARTALRIALVMLALFDVVLGTQLYHHGLPKSVTVAESAKPGVYSVSVSRIPFSIADGLMLAALLLVHALLAYLAWRDHKGNQRSQW